MMSYCLQLTWQQFCRWCCVNKNQNSRFCFKTRTIYPTKSNDGTKDNMGTISVPSRILCPTVEAANGFFLTERDWGRKDCYGNSTKGVISRTLLQYFQIYRLFSIFHFFVANNMRFDCVDQLVAKNPIIYILVPSPSRFETRSAYFV